MFIDDDSDADFDVINDSTAYPNGGVRNANAIISDSEDDDLPAFSNNRLQTSGRKKCAFPSQQSVVINSEDEIDGFESDSSYINNLN